MNCDESCILPQYCTRPIYVPQKNSYTSAVAVYLQAANTCVTRQGESSYCHASTQVLYLLDQQLVLCNQAITFCAALFIWKVAIEGGYIRDKSLASSFQMSRIIHWEADRTCWSISLIGLENCFPKCWKRLLYIMIENSLIII